MHASRDGAEREGEKKLKQALQCQCRAWCRTQSHEAETVTWAEIKSPKFNWLSHPCAPKLTFKQCIQRAMSTTKSIISKFYGENKNEVFFPAKYLCIISLWPFNQSRKLNLPTAWYFKMRLSFHKVIYFTYVPDSEAPSAGSWWLIILVIYFLPISQDSDSNIFWIPTEYQ